MEKLKLNLKAKCAYIGSIHIKSKYVPRVGEIIDLSNFPDCNKKDVNTYLVLNVKYVYVKGSLEPELDCVAFLDGDMLRELASESNHSLEAIFARKLL